MSGRSGPPAKRLMRFKRPQGGKPAPRPGSIISVAELRTLRLPCCSHTTLSSDEFREWSHRNETVLPDQKYFEQIRLVIIGYLRNKRGKKDKMLDGRVYVQDNSGTLPCVFLNFNLDWLDKLSLFLNWIYVPQIGEGTTGYLEILENPVPQIGPEKSLSTLPVFYPGTAAELLTARPQNTATKVNVAGELDRLTTILYFNQKSFFFLFLKGFSSSACVPVVIQRAPHLVWHHALQPGHRYVLTDLTTCCLKTTGQNVFTSSSSSCLLPYCKEQTEEQGLDVPSQGGPTTTTSVVPQNLFQTQNEEMMPGPLRKSELTSYTGTITQVLNAPAGLYQLDHKYVLCLAYRQVLDTGCGFRPGARVELRDVHLVERPLPSISAAFGACLHTTVVLKSFSPYNTLHQPVTCLGNHYLQLLLRYNLTLSLYLYLASLLEIFEQRFCCFTWHQKLVLSHHSQGLKEKFILPILNSLLPANKQERNFHAEILAEKHSCVLDQHQALEPPYQIPHFAQLPGVVERSCWESCGPAQRLRPAPTTGGPNPQKPTCGWAQDDCILTAECFRPQLLLLGVLEYTNNGHLQLRDRSNSLPCVILHKDGRPFTDTSLVGCLLQVNIFQLVAEQFPQNDVPSSQQPMGAKPMQKKKRLYAQFYFEDVKVLHVLEKGDRRSPTVCQQPSCSGQGSGSSAAPLRPSVRETKRKRQPTEEPSTREPERLGNSPEKISVSRLFLLIQKEGLAWRNYLPSRSENGQTTQLSFQATVLWMGKPKLCHNLGDSEEQEDLSDAQQKVVFLFLEDSLQWFPFLHVDHLYQIIIPRCTDLGIFEKKSSSLSPATRSYCCGFLFLPFPDGALVHHVRRISQSTSDMLKRQPKMFSIAEILNTSFKGVLVSFSGEIMERILCDSYSGKKTDTQASAQKKGGPLPWHQSLKLIVAPAQDSSVLLDIYIQPASVPYLWGLLPGATVLFRDLQRRVSRFGNVYCSFVASSDVCVLTPPPPNSPKHLGSTPKFSEGYLSNPPLGQAQVTCHLTGILFLSMQWSCDLCHVPTEGRPSEPSNSCSSHTGMIKATAKILVEDGTNEAMVFCKDQQVQQVLGLGPKEWEVLRNQVRTQGSVSLQHSDISTGARVQEEQDQLKQYLINLCRSPVVSRSIVLTFRADRKSFKTGSGELRRFCCNGLEFLSRMRNRPNLVCLNIQETI